MTARLLRASPGPAASARMTTGRPPRYSGEMVGFKIALGAGYSVNTDENIQARVSFGKDSGFFQAGGYVEHLATGLFLHGAYGNEDNHGTVILSGLTEPDHHINGM